MSMTSWFLNLLECNGRHRIIMDRSGTVPYMHRYYLIFKDKMTDSDPSRKLPFNAFIHYIVKSDEDGLHDHPWWYFTLILKGGYWEETPTGTFWRGPGHFRISRPTSLHKLMLPNILHGDPADDGAWTLFIRGPKVRDWGFLDAAGKWVYWETYLKNQRVAKAKLEIKFGEPEEPKTSKNFFTGLTSPE